MKNIRIKIRNFSTALVFIFSLLLLAISPQIQAADLTDRSINISSSYVSEVVRHTFGFNTTTAGNVGSIQFLYCSNSPLPVDPCVAPAGLVVNNAGIFSQSGITGFSVSGVSTANSLVITRAPVATAPTSAVYSFSNITNPSVANEVYYVRIVVYDGINGTGAVIDDGSVVFVTEDPFAVSAFVPPYLTFCTGVTVALNCSFATGFLADFGEFSSVTTTAVTSQFSVATNDGAGYNTYVSGETLTSGNNIIPTLSNQTGSTVAVSQFGINLRANTNPSVGVNPELDSLASGTPDLNYNSPNLFRYNNNDRVAFSTTPSGFNRYTISYIVNVSENQAPGFYATTLTYTAIASF